MPSTEILNKLKKYCAYQERCHEEARSKLLSLKVYGGELEEIMHALIADNFLNEERFARAYAGGKFRTMHWGRNKIKHALKAKKISAYCINKAMQEIPLKDYEHTLQKLINTALKKYKSPSEFETKQKTARLLIAKGYESILVWGCLKD